MIGLILSDPIVSFTLGFFVGGVVCFFLTYIIYTEDIGE